MLATVASHFVCPLYFFGVEHVDYLFLTLKIVISLSPNGY